MAHWLREVGEIQLFVGVWMLLILAGEIGIRLARRTAATEPAPSLSSTEGALLGLLALLLGFTFSMASDRFVARVNLVREEAGAIRSVYLRARFAQEPERSNIAALLGRYTETRFALQRVAFAPEERARVDASTNELHAQLWSEVEHAVAKDRDDVSALLVEAVNDVVDLHTQQIAAQRYHVPGPIFLLLLLVALVSLGVSGYASGPSYRQSAVMNLLVSLLVSSVLLLIVDLHRPTRGAIVVNMASMEDVAQFLKVGPLSSLLKADGLFAAPRLQRRAAPAKAGRSALQETAGVPIVRRTTVSKYPR